ncbi:MAG: transcriptional repressor [Spirochaetes bacterium]|nr:transcriptional repressor [Spirochaetota bacterium]
MSRNTVQRQIILAGLQRLNSHPTIDEVYAEVQKEHPAISKTTVYRNLRNLADEGIIRQVALPDGLERYDGFAARHYHFNCTRCGCISDVAVEYLQSLDDSIEQSYGFRVEGHDTVFTGACQDCADRAAGSLPAARSSAKN